MLFENGFGENEIILTILAVWLLGGIVYTIFSGREFRNLKKGLIEKYSYESAQGVRFFSKFAIPTRKMAKKVLRGLDLTVIWQSKGRRYNPDPYALAFSSQKGMPTFFILNKKYVRFRKIANFRYKKLSGFEPDYIVYAPVDDEDTRLAVKTMISSLADTPFVSIESFGSDVKISIYKYGAKDLAERIDRYAQECAEALERTYNCEFSKDEYVSGSQGKKEMMGLRSRAIKGLIITVTIITLALMFMFGRIFFWF